MPSAGPAGVAKADWRRPDRQRSFSAGENRAILCGALHGGRKNLPRGVIAGDLPACPNRFMGKGLQVALRRSLPQFFPRRSTDLTRVSISLE